MAEAEYCRSSGIFTGTQRSQNRVLSLFQDETKPDEITQFILDHQFPLVGAYDGAVNERYSKESPLCLVFYTVDWSFDHRAGEEVARRSDQGTVLGMESLWL